MYSMDILHPVQWLDWNLTKPPKGRLQKLQGLGKDHPVHEKTPTDSIGPIKWTIEKYWGRPPQEVYRQPWDKGKSTIGTSATDIPQL